MTKCGFVRALLSVPPNSAPSPAAAWSGWQVGLASSSGLMSSWAPSCGFAWFLLNDLDIKDGSSVKGFFPPFGRTRASHKCATYCVFRRPTPLHCSYRWARKPPNCFISFSFSQLQAPIYSLLDVAISEIKLPLTHAQNMQSDSWKLG